MARPLNNIANWQNVHGVTADRMNRIFKKASIHSPIHTYLLDDRLFSEQDYVTLMQFRKNYIMKLHSLLKERLPPRPTINIRIPKRYINYYVPHSINRSFRNYNQRVAALTNNNSRKRASRETINFTNIEIYIIYDIFTREGVTRPYIFEFSILNPENREKMQLGVPKEIDGVNIQNTVFQAVKELSDDSVSSISSLQRYRRNYLYRPGNGQLYKAASTNFSAAVGSQRKRKTRKARKAMISKN